MALIPTTTPPKVFVDTSVLFSASYSATGYARDLTDAAGAGGVVLAVSTLVLMETQRNLIAKATHGLHVLERIQANGLIEVVDPPEDLVRETGTFVAAKDAPIVAAAVHAKADYLASYDRKHLLAQAALIQARYGIVVTTPEAILRAL